MTKLQNQLSGAISDLARRLEERGAIVSRDERGAVSKISIEHLTGLDGELRRGRNLQTAAKNLGTTIEKLAKALNLSSEITPELVRRAYAGGDPSAARALLKGVRAETVEGRQRRQLIEKLTDGWDAMSADGKAKIEEEFAEFDASGSSSDWEPPAGNQGEYPGAAVSPETVRRAAAGHSDAQQQIVRAIVPSRLPWA